jgi:RNA dependent RNA polymerase
MVTPAGVYLYGPDPETRNRVLRKYSEHIEYFLRVQFCDEDGQIVRYNPTISNDDILYSRFKSVLNKGINIAGRQYGFLGFSHSSLRSQSCWFMAPFVHKGALQLYQKVIENLGDFSHIRSPAKCAARIGQAFSNTPNTIPLGSARVEEIPDVERNGRVFSDGVGTFSPSVLNQIWDALPSKHLVKPTVFQIRYSGKCHYTTNYCILIL